MSLPFSIYFSTSQVERNTIPWFSNAQVSTTLPLFDV